MNERGYLSAAAFAGRWLCQTAHPHPAPVSRHLTTGRGKAIYVVCDWAGHVVYVGSTIRGVGNRLGQHLHDAERTLSWATVWVIPLRADTPVHEVRRIEGLVGRAVLPADVRLPLPSTLTRREVRPG